MKYLITSILSIFFHNCFSQQIIEICANEPTVSKTYWIETNIETPLVWYINGVPNYTQILEVEWDSVGVYEILVTSDTLNNNCPTDTQRIQVTVNRCVETIYFVPNAFSPDGDDYNNTFHPVFTEGFDPYDFHMSIYNRWGELIFESYDASKGWNGNYSDFRCQDGIYTWKIEFGLPDYTDERKVITGHVVLIR